MISTTYNYTLLLANGQYVSILSEDSVFGVLSEYPGAQFVSRNAVGYSTVMAD